MLQHVVVFKLNAGVTWTDPRAVAAEAALAALGGQVPEVLSWRVGRNVVPRPHAFDCALVAAFANRAALERYQAQPAHEAMAALWRPIATWHVVDFELAG